MKTGGRALSDDILKQDVRYVKGVGPRRLEMLHKLGIHTIGDLLYHFPRDYEDRTQIKRIRDLRLGERATLRVRVEGVKTTRTRRRREIVYVAFRDETGVIIGVWFNTRYLRPEKFPEGREMYVTGKVEYYEAAQRVQMVSPQCEPTESESGHTGFGAAILPVYPLTEGINQGLLRQIARRVVEAHADDVPECLPPDIIRRRRLLPVADAVRNMHFPESRETASRARFRLVYEECLVVELAMALRRRSVRVEPGHAFRITERVDKRIRALFPFDLTATQEKVIAEISGDMSRPQPMNRLLQGDVGSGKTAVALYALLVGIANKTQAAIMAPTEILAEQHFRKFGRYLENSRVRTALLSGSATSAKRRENLEGVRSGEVDLVVGTHALVQKGVGFGRLGVVVIDEQHRFGVMQRADLRMKGTRPDVLVMTATPIPRTLALTVFGDLDVSTIDELPPGRLRPTTRWARGTDEPKMWEFVRERLDRGEQAFVVCPLVEESEKIDLRAATEEAARLQKQVFPDYRVGLLHGRMGGRRKQEVMADFRSGETQVLVSTVVVEVGIDVPNATVMVVEHAGRFGLATLHQLRGRIGRGGTKAWFFMFDEPTSEEGKKRLAVIEGTCDGFRLAEEDLRLRGPGDFLGTRQHGLPELQLTDPIRDFSILRRARTDAFRLVEKDGMLSNPQHQGLRRLLAERCRGRLHLMDVG